jgi:hypothetical protein
LNEKAISVTNFGTNDTIIYSFFDMPDFFSKKTSYVPSLSIYNMKADDIGELQQANIELPPIKKPLGYCADLKQVLISAHGKFEAIAGRKIRGGTDAMSKIQLTGWSDCEMDAFCNRSTVSPWGFSRRLRVSRFCPRSPRRAPHSGRFDQRV